MKKLAQVLDDDERIRDQLETLVSPSCSCKQAEACVVSNDMSEVTVEGYVTVKTISLTGVSNYSVSRVCKIVHISRA